MDNIRSFKEYSLFPFPPLHSLAIFLVFSWIKNFQFALPEGDCSRTCASGGIPGRWPYFCAIINVWIVKRKVKFDEEEVSCQGNRVESIIIASFPLSRPRINLGGTRSIWPGKSKLLLKYTHFFFAPSLARIILHDRSVVIFVHYYDISVTNREDRKRTSRMWYSPIISDIRLRRVSSSIREFPSRRVKTHEQFFKNSPLCFPIFLFLLLLFLIKLYFYPHLFSLLIGKKDIYRSVFPCIPPRLFNAARARAVSIDHRYRNDEIFSISLVAAALETLFSTCDREGKGIYIYMQECIGSCKYVFQPKEIAVGQNGKCTRGSWRTTRLNPAIDASVIRGDARRFVLFLSLSFSAYKERTWKGERPAIDVLL